MPKRSDSASNQDSGEQTSPADCQSPRFEKAIEQLELIIHEIESGDAGLERSLACYERGVKLIGQCRSILTASQKRITDLTFDAQGKPTISDPPKDDSIEASS